MSDLKEILNKKENLSNIVNRFISLAWLVALWSYRLKDKKIVTLFNKQDLRTDDEPMQDFRADKVLAISAAKNEGLEEVKAVLEEMLREDKIYIERVISYQNAGIIQLIRKQGELISEEYVAEGIAIKAYVPMEVYGKLD